MRRWPTRDWSDVAASPNGNMAAVYGTSGFAVRVRPAGGTLSDPIALPGSTGASYAARIAINDRGDVAVAWFVAGGLYLSVRPAGGSFPELPVKLSATPSIWSYAPPGVGLADDGSAIVAWAESSNARYTIRSRDGAERVGGSSPVPGADVTAVDAAINGAGDTVVAWAVRPSGEKFAVWSVSRPAGGAFGAPVRMSDSGQDATAPTVAVQDGGGAAVTWARSDGAFRIAQLSVRQDADTPFSLPTDLSATGANAGTPSVGWAAATRWWRGRAAGHCRRAA